MWYFSNTNTKKLNYTDVVCRTAVLNYRGIKNKRKPIDFYFNYCTPAVQFAFRVR